MSSELERLTVSRGGSCLVTGSSGSNDLWATSCSDFLLSKVLANRKYKKTFVYCPERNIRELNTVIQQAVLDQNLTPEIIGQVVIVNDWEKFIDLFANHGKNNSETETHAFFIYSLNDLILKYGVKSIRKYLEDLLTLMDVHCFLVAVLHTSLVSKAILEMFQSLFPVGVSLYTGGILPDEVLAEVQIVRRSVTTQRMNEAVEYVKWNKYLLEPFAKKVITKTEEKKEKNNKKKDKNNKEAESKKEKIEKEQDNSLNNSSIFSPSTQSQKKEINQIIAEREELTSSSALTSAPQSRLITFESTDPEFDEDSDPDADLDL